MNNQMPFTWFDIRGSLWYRPAIMTVLAIILSFVTIWLDNVLFLEQRVSVWWLFTGGAEGARGVLTAIAGTMMTVATTAFSFTLVALQLSSSQYSPRVVRNFTGDPVNQVVIGAFVGTFVYTLLVLRVVRSEASDQEVFVPAISVTVALLLALVCIASLIFFFHHATRTIQSSVLITRTTEQTLGVIDALADRYGDEGWLLSRELVERPRGLLALGYVRSPESGYVQEIGQARIMELATEHDLLVEIKVRAGDFLLRHDSFATIWAYPVAGEPGKDARTRLNQGEGNGNGSGDDNGDLLDEFRESFHLGLERTLEWDAEYGLQQVVDIALRALSSGINDPTTAIVTIDRIGELLVALQRISGTEVTRLDDDAVLRVCGPVESWDEYVATALEQVRFFGAGFPSIVVHVLRTIGRVLPHVPASGHEPLAVVARDICESALKQVTVETDRERIREAQRQVLRQLA